MGQDATEIPFRTIAHGNAGSDAGGGLFIHRNQETWTARWRLLHYRHRPEPPVPAVDWETDMAVVLVCGTRPSGGYRVAIESIAVDGTSIEIRAVENRPGPHMRTTQALTNPFHAVTVAAHDGEVRLILRITQNEPEP